MLLGFMYFGVFVHHFGKMLKALFRVKPNVLVFCLFGEITCMFENVFFLLLEVYGLDIYIYIE